MKNYNRDTLVDNIDTENSDIGHLNKITNRTAQLLSDSNN